MMLGHVKQLTLGSESAGSSAMKPSLVAKDVHPLAGHATAMKTGAPSLCKAIGPP